MNLCLTLSVNLVQIFDLVNREAFNSSLGVNVTGIRENYLQLNIGQGACVFMSLVPSGQDEQTVDITGMQNLESAVLPLHTFDGVKLSDGKLDKDKKNSGFPNRICSEIYLKQLFHEHVFVRAKDKQISAGRTQSSSQPAKDSVGLLGHFCMSLAHRIFSSKVLMGLESLVLIQFILFVKQKANENYYFHLFICGFCLS